MRRAWNWAVSVSRVGAASGRPTRCSCSNAAGTVVARRSQPRAALFTWPKRLGWDRLDILYFAGYALWNYLSFPHLLALPGVRVTGVEPGRPEGVQMLRAAFGPEVPTHSALQTFHVNAAGLLLRHDYTADVIGSWATAANRCLASAVVDGLRFYTRRLVTPRFGDPLVLPGPRWSGSSWTTSGCRGGVARRPERAAGDLGGPRGVRRAFRALFSNQISAFPAPMGHKMLLIQKCARGDCGASYFVVIPRSRCLAARRSLPVLASAGLGVAGAFGRGFSAG
jgi:hypothetical protein